MRIMAINLQMERVDTPDRWWWMATL